jgi:hypothetical protein
VSRWAPPIPALELMPHNGLEPPDNAFDVLDTYSASRHHTLLLPVCYTRALSPLPALYCACYTYRAIAFLFLSTTPCLSSGSCSCNMLPLPLHWHLHHPQDLFNAHHMSMILGSCVRALLGHHHPHAQCCTPGHPLSPLSPLLRCLTRLEQTVHPSSALCTGCSLLHTQCMCKSALLCLQCPLLLLCMQHQAPLPAI